MAGILAVLIKEIGRVRPRDFFWFQHKKHVAREFLMKKK